MALKPITYTGLSVPVWTGHVGWRGAREEVSYSREGIDRVLVQILVTVANIQFPLKTDEEKGSM